MDDVQLHTRIAEDFADLTLEQPLTKILSRGRRLRQRRQRLPLLGVLTLGAVAALITVQSSAHQGQAFAAWTSHAQPTDSRTATAIDRSCRGSVGALPLLVLDRRGDFALSVYTDGQTIAVCDRFRGSQQQFFTQGSISGPEAVTQAKAVTPNHPVAFEGSGASFQVHEGSASYAYGWIGSAVAKVVIDSGGYRTTATLTDGLFSAWWPGNANGTVSTVTCTAYDNAGQVLGRDTLRVG